MTDAAIRWWNILDKAPRATGWFRHERTDIATCCTQICRTVGNAQAIRTEAVRASTTRIHVKTLSVTSSEKVECIIHIHVDDLFGTGAE